jgi:hypothetical protein
MWTSKPDPWLPPPPNASASAFPTLSNEAMGPVPAARTRSPAENWLNGPPPTSNAVPVLPAKPSNDLNDVWSSTSKQPAADPWNSKPMMQQQVPDPWNSKTSSESLDPWAPVGGSLLDTASGVS